MGYNYGAGEEQRVRKIYRTALTLAAGHHGFRYGHLRPVPEPAVRPLYGNAATVQMGAEALRIISLGFLVILCVHYLRRRAGGAGPGACRP